MVESAGFENRYLGQPGSRVRIPPSPPYITLTNKILTNKVSNINLTNNILATRRGAGAA